MVFVIVLHEVPLYRPALEEVEARGAEEPEYHIHQIDPPGDRKPTLVDEEETSVKEEEGEFDRGERGTGEDHGDPDMLTRC